MESSDLNSPKPDDDGLDAELRAHLSAPVLRDDGFSDRVLAALPVVGSRTFRIRRQLFCAAGLIAGVAVATSGLIRSGDWSPNFQSLIDVFNGMDARLFAPPVALAIGITALSLWFAFRDRWRLLPRL